MYGRLEAHIITEQNIKLMVSETPWAIARRVERLNNPGPNFREYVAESGGALLDRWKQRTRDKIADSLGAHILTPRLHERDGIIYPLHVQLLSLIVDPFRRSVENRTRRINRMLWGEDMIHPDWKLYKSMSLRERRRLEDHGGPLPM